MFHTHRRNKHPVTSLTSETFQIPEHIRPRGWGSGPGTRMLRKHVSCVSRWQWARKGRGRWARRFEGGLGGAGSERGDGRDEGGREGCGAGVVNGWGMGAFLQFVSSDEVSSQTLCITAFLEKGVPECTVFPGKSGSGQVSGITAGPDYGTTNGSGWPGFCLRGPSAGGPLTSGLRWDLATACVEPRGKQTSRSGQ